MSEDAPPPPPSPLVQSEVEAQRGGVQPYGDSIVLNASGDEGESAGRPLAISGLLVGFVTGLPQLFFPILAALFGTRATSNPVLIPLVIGGVMLASLFFRWLAWTRFRYFIGEHDIRIEQGILSRQARSIPYERIQDVSIEQKPLARIFGLGEVKFETGGGEGEDAKLSFVSLSDAEELRELVRARKAGTKAIAASEADEAEAETATHPVFAMDTKRVFIFGLYSFSLIIFAVLGGIAQQFDFLLPFDLWDVGKWIGVAEERGFDVDTWAHIGIGARILFGIGALASLLFLGFATGVIRTTLREYGFRLERTAKGFRRRRGLLTLTDAVMPIHRVQAAVIQTGPIRKRRGWYALKFVSLAQDSKDETNFVAAPFARLSEIWSIAQEADIEPPPADLTLRRAPIIWWLRWLVPLAALICIWVIVPTFTLDLSLNLTARLWLLLIPAALLLCVRWRLYGDAHDGRQIFIRQGWWRERLEIAPQVKIQSVEIAQGPVGRKLGLATIHFGLAGGHMAMTAVPIATARAIRDEVTRAMTMVDYSKINSAD